MTGFVNRIPVKTGDVFFVDAGVIHAIGAGCLILEVQEPTDFTIQPEYWCGDYHLNAQEMYLGLEPDTALDCFHFHQFGKQVVENGKKVPRVVGHDGTVKTEILIDKSDTPCFAMNRYTLTQGVLRLEIPASVWICADGQGMVSWEGGSRSLKKGDYFFLPAAAIGKCSIQADRAVIISCVGGK